MPQYCILHDGTPYKVGVNPLDASRKHPFNFNMVSSLLTGLLAVILSAHLITLSNAFTPDYQSVLWTDSGKHYWSPLGLNSTAFQFASPPGSPPDALNKRKTYTGSGLIPCTVFTLNNSGPLITSDLLSRIVNEYKNLDDVWTESFLECVFIQTSGSISMDPSFSAFIEDFGVKVAFVSTSVEMAGLVIPSSLSMFPTSSDCSLSNGPYIASFSACGTGLGMFPVFALHNVSIPSQIASRTRSNEIPGSISSIHGMRFP